MELSAFLSGFAFGQLPDWWTVRARARFPLENPIDGVPRNDPELLEAELEARWAAPDLARSQSFGSGLSYRSTLDLLAFFLQQPDIDVDGDGLESFYDDDGDEVIDRCVDGDGETTYPGNDCIFDPAFVDAYQLLLRFALVAVTVR